MMMDDRVASEVWASHTEVRDVTRLPGTVSPNQEVSAMKRGQAPVTKPAPILLVPSKDMVDPGNTAAKNPTPGRAHDALRLG